MPYNRVGRSACSASCATSVEPYLRIFRRFIPPFGPLDLSPIVALIVLQVVAQRRRERHRGLVRDGPAARAWLRAALVLAAVAGRRPGHQGARARAPRGRATRTRSSRASTLVHVRNRGVAFSALEGRTGIVTAVIALAVLALVGLVRPPRRRARWSGCPSGLLAGGAAGQHPRPRAPRRGHRLPQAPARGRPSTWPTWRSPSASWPCSTSSSARSDRVRLRAEPGGRGHPARRLPGRAAGLADARRSA